MKTTLPPQLAAAVCLCLLFVVVAPPSGAARELSYAGMCDASAAEALDGDNFVVADDEDNVRRIYNRTVTTGPIQKLSLSAIFPGEIQDGEDQELDLEGAAVPGDKIFWVGSHSASKKGKFRPARHCLFALQIKQDAVTRTFITERVGKKIYRTLLSDLEKDHRFDKYKIQEAKTIRPKDVGGLSIEGLAATPEGALLIGFRNPLSGGEMKDGKLTGGRALIVPLLNPSEVLEGGVARFGDPVELYLDGLGIRSLERRRGDKYLVVAGPYDENLGADGQRREESRLYLWSRRSGRLHPLEKIGLGGLNVEAAFFYPRKKRQVQLLSDDGKPTCGGSFRALLQDF